MPQRLARGLELRVLAFWAAVLEIDAAVLDVDGLVVVRDPRSFAVDRRAVIRTARGAIALAAPRDAASAAADPAAFVDDVEARPRGVGLLHYLAEVPHRDGRVMRLVPADAPLLETLQEAAGPDAAAEADVSIEHALAVGIVEGGRLLAIASLIDEGSGVLDVGVLVHPESRGRGLGRAVVADVAARAADGLVQYRCNRENSASSRVAQASGFVLWGVLQVAAR